jgi:hypothetical protein
MFIWRWLCSNDKCQMSYGEWKMKDDYTSDY